QIENRIPDDLPGAMIRDIAAPVRRLKFHIHLREKAITRAQMFHFAIAAERDYVWVLAKKQHVRHGAALPRIHQSVLQFERSCVANEPRVDNPALSLQLIHSHATRTSCGYQI